MGDFAEDERGDKQSYASRDDDGHGPSQVFDTLSWLSDTAAEHDDVCCGAAAGEKQSEKEP